MLSFAMYAFCILLAPISLQLCCYKLAIADGLVVCNLPRHFFCDTGLKYFVVSHSMVQADPRNVHELLSWGLVLRKVEGGLDFFIRYMV